jgi:hypothetical protein
VQLASASILITNIGQHGVLWRNQRILIHTEHILFTQAIRLPNQSHRRLEGTGDTKQGVARFHGVACKSGCFSCRRLATFPLVFPPLRSTFEKPSNFVQLVCPRESLFERILEPDRKTFTKSQALTRLYRAQKRWQRKPLTITT